MALFRRNFSRDVNADWDFIFAEEGSQSLVVRGHSLKVMQYVATQRDEEKRQLYWFALFDLGVRPEHLLFCDDT